MVFSLTSAGLFIAGVAVTTGGIEGWRRVQAWRDRKRRHEEEARRPKVVPSKAFRSIREQIPRGDMVVHWTNRDGSEHSGDVVNVSMKGVFFETTEFDADGIQRISSEKHGVDLAVKNSIIIRQGESGVAIMLVEFENDENAWMSWIELMTRLN